MPFRFLQNLTLGKRKIPAVAQSVEGILSVFLLLVPLVAQEEEMLVGQKNFLRATQVVFQKVLLKGE